MESRSHGPDRDRQGIGYFGTAEAGVVREHDDGTLVEAKSVESAIERISVHQLRDLVGCRRRIDRVDGDVETGLQVRRW